MPSVRPALKSGFCLAFLAALAASYFKDYPIPHLLLRFREGGTVLIWLLSAGVLGQYFLNILKINEFYALEEEAFSVILGLGIQSSLMIGLGLLRTWTPLAAWIVLGVPLIGTLRHGRWRLLISELRTRVPVPSVQGSLPLLGLLIGGLFTLVLALAPITYYDSLVYHLALPAAYLRAQHWVGLTDLIYSAFPQTTEMLWTLGLLVGDAVTVNLLSWSLSVLILLLVIAFGKRFLQVATGLWAAGLMMVMPAFMLLSSGGYVENALTLFSFASLYAACLGSQSKSQRLFLLSGLFAGWAMGTKYTGVIPAFLTGLLIVWNMSREVDKRDVWRAGALYAFSAVLLMSPWLIKNMYYVGNPVFPFFYNWGASALNPWLNQGAAGYFSGITEYAHRSLNELPVLLWQMLIDPIRFGGGADVLGNLGWTPFIAFLPGLALVRKQSKAGVQCLVYASLFFMLWGTNRPVLRFLMPLLPVLALLVAEGWINGIARQPRWVLWVFRSFLGLFVGSGLFLFFFVTHIFSPFDVALGLEDKDVYLTQKIDYYGAANFINTQLPRQGVLVYVFGDQRGYYYERPIRLSPIFSLNRLVQWANAASTAEALQKKLQDEGITHVLVNRSEMKRLSTYHFSSFDGQGERNWQGLKDHHMKTLYQDAHCDVLELLPA